MAKKIILFLSSISERATERVYACPDGGSVAGTQTNEAPVKYLLRAWPEVSEILCVVTPEAMALAWDWFVSEVGALSPEVRVTKIPFPAGEDFTRGPLRELLDRTRSGDEILLETTGGPRDAAMYLLLTSRVLSDAGVKTREFDS